MGGRQRSDDDHKAEFQPADDELWPETKTNVLKGASRGDWSAFLRHYLRPCWREIVIRCRVSGMPLTDADDLFQELMVRLMRDAQFSRKVQEALRNNQLDPTFRGNLPARFLRFRELPLRSARFRTYLKAVMQNVVREALRRQRAFVSADAAGDLQEPWITDSISQSLDRRWIVDCLIEAAEQLRKESEKASTAGRRRLFEILYLAFVEDCSKTAIAEKYGRDRTVISRDWTQARTRFIEILKHLTGIDDEGELRQLVNSVPGALREAFVRVAKS